MNVPANLCRARLANQESINDSFFYFSWILHSFYERAALAILINGMVKTGSATSLGASLSTLFWPWKETVHMDNYVFGWSMPAMPMPAQRRLKITQIERPFASRNILNYILSKDLAEQNDLRREEFPWKYQEMLSEWSSWSQKVGVIWPTP